jgi:hypothetical protein
VQWNDSETKSKVASKPTKAKQARKTAKKAVQAVSDKIEASVSGASTTGAEGDDDMSPAVSPKLDASTSMKAPSGRDVSDMLESNNKAPSVLRISPSEKPERANKAKQQRTEAPQETKKQRQNRKKAEEAKQQREADEKARQVLLEQQRRTAREARGEPAKNGLQPAKAPAANAWASSRPAAEVVAAPPTNGQLLDTFEPEAATTGPKASTTNGAENGISWTPGMSEEEQIRLAMEDSAWETVPKGKKQKKTKPAEETAEETNTNIAPPVVAPVKQAPAPQVGKKQTPARYSLLEETTDKTHPDDSEWGVV